jgi:spore maturation protein CgeB
MFEALASGIPLISAPWEDSEGLFRTGTDYLRVEDGPAMRRAMRAVLDDPAMARELARNGRETILARHGCEHRVDELFEILRQIAPDRPATHAPGAHPHATAAETVSS